MEVDERLRWLESRISSSLHPRGDELRNLFTDEENRAAFLAFCNHSESRRLFVYLVPEWNEDNTEGVGQIVVSASPPRNFSDKALFFLKCNHSSKLNREKIGSDVLYSESSSLPLNHLELVMREVYLPLMSSRDHNQYGVSGDKLLDLLHRLLGTMQVTRGLSEGRVVLPLPSIEVLAEAASSSDRRGTVIHIMESSVVYWMKQVKVAMHFDPNSSILRLHGKYAGPLSEYEFWSNRLSSLESVRKQLNSGVVLNILHGLDQAHSTYSQSFIHVHRDIGKAVADTEHCLVYLNTLQPWLLKLEQAHSPESQIRLFSSIMTTLLLIWQHSGVYSIKSHFYRILRLISNKMMQKAKEIIGEDVLTDPEQSLFNLKLSLRVCAAFRGCYLDFREKSEIIAQKLKDGSGEKLTNTSAKDVSSRRRSLNGGGGQGREGGSKGGGGREGGFGGGGDGSLCAWPPRNSVVFSPLNAIMERCNDLVELVQTLHDFKELEPYPFSCDGNDVATTSRGDPIVADIYHNFRFCMTTFQNQAKDLLNLELDCSFEEYFFHFRLRMKDLEQRLVPALKRAFDSAPTLPAQLKVLEMYQGIIKRDTIKADFSPQLSSIVSNLMFEVSSVKNALVANVSHPPSLPLTPPTACKLLWLIALRERVKEPMEVVRRVAPELLEGDEGWKLRQDFGDVISQIENYISQTETNWTRDIPTALYKKLRDNILTRSSDGHLVVNFDPGLSEILSEVKYLTRPPISLRLPTSLRHLMRSIDYSELRHRHTSLQVIIQAYNELQDSLSDIDRMLLQHKLQQIENLLQVGQTELDWVGTAFPDFTARASAAVCGDLQTTLDQVHSHMDAICVLTKCWRNQEGLDMFQTQGEGPYELADLEQAHSVLLESLRSSLPPSMERIAQHISLTFECIHEASKESPAWTAYLAQIDDLIQAGLKKTMLKAISTLYSRALKYEQGDPIPCLVTVELELQGEDVQFSPPLSTFSSVNCVPEVVQKWMSNYLSLAKLGPRFSSTVDRGTCFDVLSSDGEVKNAMSKICAHLVTNSRQCQSLRKRFTIYSFLWEQDVGSTFSDFLHGRATPHPRRFTRPETVRSRSSARAHSGGTSRPKSSTASLTVLAVPPPESRVIGVADWDFLRSPGIPVEGEDTSHRPSLDDFDSELAVFQGVLDRLKSIENINNVGWVCVNQRPIKQSLSSLSCKWKHVYASYLEKQVSQVLSNLEAFFEEIEPEVEAISGEESDTQAFMKLMSIFNRVNLQQVEMDTKFGTAHRAVLMLDKFEHPLRPEMRRQFNNSPTRWSNLKKRVALGKQRIGPRIQAKGDLISQDLSSFGETFMSLRTDFISSQCLRHGCEKSRALDILEEFEEELTSLQSQARDLIELQELLETSVFNFSLMKEFQDELSTLRDLWNMYEFILGQHTTWHGYHWNEIESSVLLAGTEGQVNLLSGLPIKIVQSWDVYIYLTEAVSAIQMNVPIVEGLKSSAMRPRHWKQVLRFATVSSHLLGRGGTFDPSLLEEFIFGQLLEMNLHKRMEEILSLVERASKDVAIESLLNTFEEVWLSRQLELKLHRRVSDITQQEATSDLDIDGLSHPTSTTPNKSRVPSSRVTSAVRRTRGVVYPTVPSTPGGVGGGGGGGFGAASMPLLSSTGGLFETLENHQTSLQSLEGTVAAVSFADELHKWHRQLQTIEAVLVVWIKVQHLWVQLEEVYSSSEIQQHLSSYAFTFSNADREFRDLMSSTTKNPAVLAICLKDGLLLSLDKLHVGLLECQAALVQYVEGQRLKCPWFYFLPLEDILQLVCYGSSLHQFSRYIPKLIRFVSSLVFDGDFPDTTPFRGVQKGVAHGQEKDGASVITGVVGINGGKMNLVQSVSCDGPIEGIISRLISSITSTLQSHLTSALITKSPTPSHPPQGSPPPPPPPLSSLHGLWRSNKPSQTVILASIITLEVSLFRAAKQASSSESREPLDELFREIYNSLKVLFGFLRGRDHIERVKSNSKNDGTQSIESQSYFGSSVALKASASSDHVDPSDYSSSVILADDTRIPQQDKNSTAKSQPTSAQITLLRKIAVVLYDYQRKANDLGNLLESSPPNMDLMKSSVWESMLHFKWCSDKEVCHVEALSTSVLCGQAYSETVKPLVCLPQNEKLLHLMLQNVNSGTNTLLIGEMSIGKSSLVDVLSLYVGQPLLSFHCSEQVSCDTIVNHIKGMAATGSWMFLHSINKLQPSVLQTTCSLLSSLEQARQRDANVLQWMGEEIQLFSSSHSPGGGGGGSGMLCFASITAPIATTDYTLPPLLPSSLASAFKICSMGSSDRTELLRILFSVQLFDTASGLSTSLNNFCCAYEEIFAPLSEISSSSQINHLWLETIVLLTQRHMKEFYSLGALSADDDDQQMISGDGLHMPSVVYSEISGSARTSIRERQSGTNDEDSDESYQKSLQKQSLEEFSLVLALRDSLLSLFLPSSQEYLTVIKLISDVFPNCDLEGLLAHEANVREGMAVKARLNREAGESVRESRATSVMQMMREDNHPSEVFAVSTLEEQIVQGCCIHQFVPTPSFQASVAQIINLVQAKRFVAVCGPSGCGKTAALKVVAEALRQSSSSTFQICHVSITTIAVQAMKEEQLLGYQDEEKGLWHDGVLVQLLTTTKCGKEDSSNDKIPSQWFVLEGIPTPHQMDALASCCHDGTLTLSNGHCISIDPSIRFILELSDSNLLSPALAAKVARVVLSQDTISWKDIVMKWLHTLPKHASVLWEALEMMFDKYIPNILQFISPALDHHLSNDSSSTNQLLSSVSVDTSTTSLAIQKQELKLSQVHLVNSCCSIFQSLLDGSPTDGELERSFIYSVVWAFGGFLSASNKIIFDRWWRLNFNPNSPEYRFPDGGMLWDYYVKPGSKNFISWNTHLPPLSLPADKTEPLFVPSVRSAAITHLIGLLISRGSPILLNGAKGSGKTALLKHFLSNYCKAKTSDAKFLHIYCNLLTSAEVIWNQVLDCLDWDWGKKYTPKGSKKLVVFIDDLYNVKSSSVNEFIRQHLSMGSVCDPATAKWHDTSDVSYLVTTDHSSQVASSAAPNFLKHFVVLQWDEYSSPELVHILDTLMRAHFFPSPPLPLSSSSSSSSSPSPNMRCLTPDVGRKMVEATIQIHSKLNAMFLSTPERLHYHFTFKDLTAVFRHLCIKFSKSSSLVDLRDIMLEWHRDLWWKWAGQMTSQVDRDRYWEVVSHTLTKYFNQDKMLPTLLLESSCRLPDEAIEEMGTKLRNELYEYNLSHPILHINLYKCTVEEVWYLCRVINSPPDLSHAVIIGHTHPESLVRLAALHCGYTIVQTSQLFSQSLFHASHHSGMSPSSYCISQFRKDLMTVYTMAGMRNEKMVLLLTDKELLHESFLICVYEFVKGYAISALFNKEDQAKIVNGVRGDMTQMGLAFSKQKAWGFFLNRVRTNLRVVISLPEPRRTMKSGCLRWKGLLDSMSIYTQLPWERKRLVDVATYHLKDFEYLSAVRVENHAHLLASIHLQLRSMKGIASSNNAYQYFVERFVHEMNEDHQTVQSKSSQLSLALGCLHRATERVASLREKIKREEVVLAEKKEACIKLLTQIGQDTAISRQHSKLVTKERERIVHLKKVIPDFEHAHSLAVQEKETLMAHSCQLVMDMDHESLSELRSLQRPAPDIEELLVAVITILKGVSADFSWTKGAKRLMANLDRFHELLLEFSACEENSEVLLESLESLIMKPSFSSESLSKHKTVGVAASQLYSWVEGVVHLHSILQTKIRPLQLKVKNMKSSLSEYSEKLKKEDHKVSVLENRLEGLSAALESSSVEKNKQREFLNNMKKELKETQDFISSLSGLQEHWKTKLDSCSITTSQTVGPLCLSVTLACYLASSEPHTQMEVVNIHLLPLLKERGIELKWEESGDLMSSIAGVRNTLYTRQSAGSDGGVSGSGDDVNPLSRSFSSMGMHILSCMLPESLSDHWISLVASHHSISYLLYLGLVHTSWNRWPLVYDPQNFASLWLKRSEEEIVYLDAMDRSSGFYLSLEHALVHGEKVLISHFPCPSDPALQPIIELGHTWDTSKGSSRVIHFCGHRLRVHPRFQLYMTTLSPPSTLPPSLTTDVNTVNMELSFPLVLDALLDVSFELFLEEGHSQFRILCGDVASLKERLRSLEEEVFRSLPKEGRGSSYWSFTEKIEDIVRIENEVKDSLQSKLKALKDLCQTLSSLIPIARHGAYLYIIMCQLGKNASPHRLLQNWEHFSDLFKETLTGHIQHHPSVAKDVYEGDSQARSKAVDGIIQQLNQALLQDAFRHTDHPTWSTLAWSLALLSGSDFTSTLIVTEQLLYIARGEMPLSDHDLIVEEPEIPTHINMSPEAWKLLHKIPLSIAYYELVLKSIHKEPQFWERTRVCTRSEDAEAPDISDFPWRSLEPHTSVNDLVMLKFLNEDAYVQKMTGLVRSLTSSISVPLLSEMFQPAANSQSPQPVLLLYEESCPRSQALLYKLEKEIEKVFEKKKITSLKMSHGSEAMSSNHLTQPKSDVLLLMDVQFTSKEWREKLVWRIQQASKSGCRVIITSSARCELPGDLTATSFTAHLSRLSTEVTQSLPPGVWMVDSYTDILHNFNALLQFNLANLPEDILSQCHSLDMGHFLFVLVTIHTAVALGPVVGDELTPVHYTNLLACINRLVSMATARLDRVTLIQSLSFQLTNVYGGCVSREKLDNILTGSLSVETCLPDATIRPHPGVEIRIPESAAFGISLKSLLDHVRQQSTKTDTEHFLNRKQSISKSLLLPLLVQLPSPELYNLSFPTSSSPSSSHPSSPSHHVSDQSNRAIAETLEYCSEKLPQLVPVSFVAEELGDAVKMELVSRLPVSSLLKSAEDYQSLLYYRLVRHFNSTILKIQRDIDVLTRHVAVSFDSLPEVLHPVLTSLEEGIMPRRWRRLQSESRPTSLDEGIAELVNWYTTFKSTS